MNYNDFGGAVIPAMAGFLFGKRAKVQEIRHENSQQLPAVIKQELGGLTSVSKYLATVPLITTVTKYMKNQEKQQITSVEKYVLRQAIAQKNVPSPTGVAKYISKTENASSGQKKSTVDKYLLKLDLAAKQTNALTGVAKYEAEQNLIEKKNAAAAMIKKYKEAEQAAALAAREAAEVAAVNAAADYESQIEEIEPPAATGIGRYLQAQAVAMKNAPKVTGVAKYVAQKIAKDSEKPALSTVEKYLQQQVIAERNKPTLTGVAKYLSKQPKHTISGKKENPVESGVARYLATLAAEESNKPVLSGVSKYLFNQAKLDSQRASDIKLIEQTSEEMSIEGEFIPAEKFGSMANTATGVSRYLEKQGMVLDTAHQLAVDVTANATNNRVSGVSKYLEKKMKSSNQAILSRPTGVDKYLLGRA